MDSDSDTGSNGNSFAYRDSASRYSYIYSNAYGHTAAAHGAANDRGNQYTHRAVIDPAADATSRRAVYARSAARPAARSSDGGESR